MTAVAGLLTIAMIAAGPVERVDVHLHIPAEFSYGDQSPWVAELNRQLSAAGFHPDDGDTFGKQTREAVYALQKHYELPTTGTFTTEMWDLLRSDIELPTRLEPNRVEIDLGKHVL